VLLDGRHADGTAVTSGRFRSESMELTESL
jgi:hypothetical protein